MLKNKTRLCKNFNLRDRIPKDLTSGVVCKFQCGLCNNFYYGECVRHLNARIGNRIGVSSLTKKQVKPKNNFVADHLLFCNHSASFDDFSSITRENKNYLQELKENLLIMRDQRPMIRNSISAPL